MKACSSLLLSSHELIQDEVKYVPLANIVLGGISQGCATAVRAMLNFDGQNAGAFVGVWSRMPFLSSIHRLGMKVNWKVYEDGGHWIKEPQGFDDLIDFLDVTFGLTCFQ